jgi:hypothetical protein
MYYDNHLTSLIKQYTKNQNIDVLKIFDELLLEIEREIYLSKNCISEDYKNGMLWTLHSYHLRIKIIRDFIKQDIKKDNVLKQIEIVF